jgi:Clp amino terminal domain, pathogenicity island component
MFERYTEKARRVVYFARYEASEFGSSHIETEHLLLGLLRENPALTKRVLPSINSIKIIREEIDKYAFHGGKTPTSVDLPLSNESKRVLAYAAEEAEHLTSKHIGTEHILLGLLREKRALAAQVLNSQGLALDRAREIVSEWQKITETMHDIVEIHNEEWDKSYVEAQLVELRKFAWRRCDWRPLDILVESTSGRICFDLTRKDDLGFKLVRGGWPRDYCYLCRWEFNAIGGPEHGIGYTNGRDWICSECHDKFLGPSEQAST